LLTCISIVKLLKTNDSEKLDIKIAELEFCICGYHAFHALENHSLVNVLQQSVNNAGEHGGFDVKDVLYGRNTISSFRNGRATEIKKIFESCFG